LEESKIEGHLGREEDNLNGKTVIVTGAGGGLGKGIARRLAQDGFSVAVTDLDPLAAEEAASGIRDSGYDASAYALDVSDAASAAEVVAEIAATKAPLYGLVNNAGIGRATPFLDIQLKDWERVFAVNSTGAFLMSQAVLPHLLDRGDGAILNISSIAGKDGFPLWVHYSATKHAIIGLTRGLAREFGPHGIRVNALCPGAIKTAIWGPEAQATDDPDTVFDLLASKTALGRGQSVEDIASAASFLLGPESSNITGVALSVDSGLNFS
jgi:NAD(P)-dependent dehydrogenase (short-subunit alcohol dehydrogenase family)